LDLLYQHQWFCLISQGGLLAVGLGSPQPFASVQQFKGNRQDLSLPLTFFAQEG
ncbi:hypothetical protein M9458_030938, partial [Cirrhinus mrigala]